MGGRKPVGFLSALTAMITRPVPGNRDYATSAAAPYYAYFGAPAGAVGKGY